MGNLWRWSMNKGITNMNFKGKANLKISTYKCDLTEIENAKEGLQGVWQEYGILSDLHIPVIGACEPQPLRSLIQSMTRTNRVCLSNWTDINWTYTRHTINTNDFFNVSKGKEEKSAERAIIKHNSSAKRISSTRKNSKRRRLDWFYFSEKKNIKKFSVWPTQQF